MAWGLFDSDPTAREQWYSHHNMVPPEKPAAGWSSHGQPVDQVHAQFRQKIRELDLRHCHMFDNLAQRPSYEELSLRASGLDSVH